MSVSIAKPRPLANPLNLVFWRNYRLTVLTDGLFRLEKGSFSDDATQIVFYRDLPPASFSAEEREGRLHVRTERCTLILAPKRRDCRVLLGERELPLSNAGNLGGTCRTLDNCDGEIRYAEPWKDLVHKSRVSLGNGVCSKSGVAVLRDSSLPLGEDGFVRPAGSRSDEYIFAFGHDYRAAVRALYLITGFPPLVPRFILGNWWSRYHAYSAEEYLRLFQGFRREGIPFTVATVDMDWHYSDEEDILRRFGGLAEEQRGSIQKGFLGWTGYTWNPKLFPDHRDFLQKLNKMGLKVTLNLHPADGFRYWEDCYAPIAEFLGRDPAEKKPIPFDATDRDFLTAYFRFAHHPLEEEGVRFWWIDWQQGEHSKIKGLDPLWALNHCHFLDSASRSRAPVILSRYAGVGSHRYPIGFSGDTFVSWRTLGYLPYFTATATNLGYTYWSHDIGGHQRGEMSRELYLRHIQYGVFSPICRLHGCSQETMTKEPDVYGAEGLVAREYLRLRHRLIPYLYTFAHRTHTEGRALVEPLYYSYDQREAYIYGSEYFFGDLLVIPVRKKADRDGYARVKGWLPEGVWTDLSTRDRYTIPAGGRELLLLRRKEEYPVFAREGTILPLSDSLGFGAENPASLTVLVYAGDGDFTLYEDDVLSERDGERFTRFSARRRGEIQELTVSAEGDVSPSVREMTVLFYDIPAASEVFLNGVPYENLLANCAAARFSLRKGECVSVTVRFPPADEREERLSRATRILLGAEGSNDEKERLHAALKQAETVSDFRAAVERSRLPQAVKLRLTEAL